MRTYIQNQPRVWITTASLAASGSATSGSFTTDGYGKIVGILISSASMKAGSGLRVYQSLDNGANWDANTEYAPSACSGSRFSIEVVGDAAKIEVIMGDDDASTFRAGWWLRPI